MKASKLIESIIYVKEKLGDRSVKVSVDIEKDGGGIRCFGDIIGCHDGLDSLVLLAENGEINQYVSLQEFIGQNKPCPFCGSTDLGLNCWEEYVVCNKCNASAPRCQWQFRA